MRQCGACHVEGHATVLSRLVVGAAIAVRGGEYLLGGDAKGVGESLGGARTSVKELAAHLGTRIAHCSLAHPTSNNIICFQHAHAPARPSEHLRRCEPSETATDDQHISVGSRRHSALVCKKHLSTCEQQQQ